MKFVRLLLIWLGVLVVLVGILFTSPLQTWIAQTLLDRQAGWKSSIGEVWAGFGQIKVTDLRVEANGAILTVPSLQVRLPLSTAARDHSLIVRSLVAKGWTLDLSELDEPPPEPTAVASVPAGGTTATSETQAADSAVKKVEEIFRGVLGGWKSPYDLAVDGVELEGDVIVNVSLDRAPIKIHVLLKGGGLSGGHEGDFAIDADSVDPWPDVSSVSAHGHLLAGMSTPRAFNRIGIKADLTAQGRRFPAGLAMSVDLTANHDAGETAVDFDVVRDQRQLASIQARISLADAHVAGSWKVNGRDTDWATLAPQRRLPAIAFAGEGRFDADRVLSQIHVAGRLDAETSHLEVLAPALAQIGTVTLATRFDMMSRGRMLHVEALEVSVAGKRPVATVRALKAFDFYPDTGELQAADPAGDWLALSVQGLPLNWLSGLTGKFIVAGGDAVGECVVRAEKNGYFLQAKSPLLATGVALERAGRKLGRDLDLSLSLLADSGPDGWRVKSDPLTITSAGRRLATLSVTASRPASTDQPVAITGTWTADLDAIADQLALVEFAGMTARSASGDFNATVENGMELDAKLSVTGHDPSHTLTATVHTNSIAGGTVTFQVPITLGVGKERSVFSAEGSWNAADDGVRLSGRLSGEDVNLDHLRLLAAPLAVVTGISGPQVAAADSRGLPAMEATPDRKPFWTGWSGEVTLAFNRLRSGGKVYREAGATFDLDETSVAMKRAWLGLDTGNPAEAEGSLTFDAAAGAPYRLKATGSINDIDAGPLLATAPKEQARRHKHEQDDDLTPDTWLEGHFSIAANVTGNGSNLADLIRNAREQFQVTSKGGIIRLLKTTVGDAFSEEAPTAMADAAGTVGGWLGWLAGVDKHAIGAGDKKVSKQTEAVLNLTSQIAEIGYDQISVTATRGQDQTIHLDAIEMTSRDERLTGSGLIAGNSGQPLVARPLTMELKLGVRGNVAALLSQAGLVTNKNDELGYLELVRPLHFGGTLQNCDSSDWREMLVKAATPPVPVKK